MKNISRAKSGEVIPLKELTDEQKLARVKNYRIKCKKCFELSRKNEYDILKEVQTESHLTLRLRCPKCKNVFEKVSLMIRPCPVESKGVIMKHNFNIFYIDGKFKDIPHCMQGESYPSYIETDGEKYRNTGKFHEKTHSLIYSVDPTLPEITMSFLEAKGLYPGLSIKPREIFTK